MNRNKIVGALMLFPITLIAIAIVSVSFMYPQELYLLGLSIIVSMIVVTSLCLAEKGIRKLNENSNIRKT